MTTPHRVSLDPRATSIRPLRRAVASLAAFNARHPWNHNEHFHGWVGRRGARDARGVSVGLDSFIDIGIRIPKPGVDKPVAEGSVPGQGARATGA